MSSLTLFTNTSSELFEHKWNGVNKRFEPGESKWFEEGVAKHFAKHLAQRELSKEDSKRSLHPSRVEAKAVEYISQTEKSETPEEDATDKNQKKTFCNQCDSKGVRHKKICPTQEEEEFPDLKTDETDDEKRG